MRISYSKTIAAAAVATIVISIPLLTGCQGRKMTNMEPTGDTVEVVISAQNDIAPLERPDTTETISQL